MDWLKNLLGNNPVMAMVLPSLLSVGTFAVHLVAALSDGVIDSTEYHQLLASANGLETLLLFAVMYALAKKKKK